MVEQIKSLLSWPNQTHDVGLMGNFEEEGRANMCGGYDPLSSSSNSREVSWFICLPLFYILS